MPTTLYKTPIPDATTPTEREGLATQLTEQGVLGGDAIVDALSSEAADLTLTGRYAYGQYYSELLAHELEELADSSLSAVPLYGGDSARAGYYEASTATVEPVHSGGRDIWEWELSLTRVGTRKSHLQAVETTISQPTPGHSFGNDQTTEVAIPAAAQTIRVIDSTSQPTERSRPTPVRTVATEFGDVDIYDATAESIGEPVYLYDVAKDAQPPVDVHVYDTNGRDSKYIEADNGRVRAWQSVFDTAHEFGEGAIVLENGRLRITIDEPTNDDATASLEAEQWDPGTAGGDGAWTTVDLPTYPDTLDTDWEPVDVDLVRIGQAHLAAQVEFEAVAGTNVGDVYSLDLELERGRDVLEVWIPASVTDPVPTDLQALLTPIASTSVVDSGVEQGLVAREEVRL